MKDWIMELCPEIAEWQAEMLEEAALNTMLAEREACAKLCDDLVRSYWNSTGDEDEPDAYDCAAAIRARSYK